MADTKNKIKDTIDQGAAKAKDGTQRAVDKGQDAAKKVGETVKDACQKNQRTGQATELLTVFKGP